MTRSRCGAEDDFRASAPPRSTREYDRPRAAAPFKWLRPDLFVARALADDLRSDAAALLACSKPVRRLGRRARTPSWSPCTTC